MAHRRTSPCLNQPCRENLHRRHNPSRPSRHPSIAKVLTHDDLIDFTPALRKQALSIVEDYDYGALYTPPTEKGTIAMPGIIGGASWAGAAVDPNKGIIYIPSYTYPAIITINKAKDLKADYTYTGALAFGPQRTAEPPLNQTALWTYHCHRSEYR